MTDDEFTEQREWANSFLEDTRIDWGQGNWSALSRGLVTRLRALLREYERRLQHAEAQQAGQQLMAEIVQAVASLGPALNDLCWCVLPKDSAERQHETPERSSAINAWVAAGMPHRPTCCYAQARRLNGLPVRIADAAAAEGDKDGA